MSDESWAQREMDQALRLQRAGQIDDAEDAYRRLLASGPAYAAVLNNLANVLKDTGRIEEAVELCRRAVALEPSNPELHSSLCYKLLFHPGYDRAEILAEQAEWNSRHGSFIAQSAPARPDGLASSGGAFGRRIRVGYVSPDFYGHAECFFVLPLLKHHDKTKFEIHCYSSTKSPDRATSLFQRNADVWHEVSAMSDRELAEMIRADRMDVLVDLTMHMANNRLAMFALRPALVQVTWLAYPGGTGLPAIDYRLTDEWIDPAGSDGFYVERSVRLPGTWICYDPLGAAAASEPRKSGPVTFGCLNNPCKLNKPTLDLWSKVLRAVPTAELMLLVNSARQRERISSAMTTRGIDSSRVHFVSYGRRGDYLRLYDRIDICLDPLIYNGVTTTCDALWMGVPVLTRLGATAAGRAGLSILSNLELDPLIARNDDQFVDIAQALAADRRHLLRLREILRQRMEKSPLMDGARFARHVEHVYREALTAAV